ncbi:MAG TPA: proline dehydrogenase family protein [Aggregatilinea sp.]|jgi:proline dehydrogenase|uniref:proline dehydrogenase family protein n=1 Tax=Aggregatilinea sp. TaxID=2806333 RepID=UPI002BBD0B48|nr:proline dehydrogenase family protein [Aggregatilinea sp.]HML21543.1 proline dehydrogenase family protein [Aggregatilinea sp.]
MLRSSFLYLSEATWAKSWIMRLSIAQRTAYRFVAGDTLDDALAVTRALNQRGIDVTLDELGESVFDEASALSTTDSYLKVLDTIASSDVSATVSLKLTQLGLDIREDLCMENMRRILTRARELGNHITIDMEGTSYTDATIGVFRALRAEGFDNVGIVIQAYLYRSESDLRALAEEGAFVRLCKGAYKEPPDRAFAEKTDVDANYVHLAQMFLTKENLARGAYLGVATHDEAMIRAVQEHVKANDIPLDGFEFQMLYGIRPRLQQQIHDDGYRIRLYIPYGTQWYPYFMRRLAERPANVWFVLSNFFRR